MDPDGDTSLAPPFLGPTNDSVCFSIQFLPPIQQCQHYQLGIQMQSPRIPWPLISHLLASVDANKNENGATNVFVQRQCINSGSIQNKSPQVKTSINPGLIPNKCPLSKHESVNKCSATVNGNEESNVRRHPDHTATRISSTTNMIHRLQVNISLGEGGTSKRELYWMKMMMNEKTCLKKEILKRTIRNRKQENQRQKK